MEDLIHFKCYDFNKDLPNNFIYSECLTYERDEFCNMMERKKKKKDSLKMIFLRHAYTSVIKIS